MQRCCKVLAFLIDLFDQGLFLCLIVPNNFLQALNCLLVAENILVELSDHILLLDIEIIHLIFQILHHIPESFNLNSRSPENASLLCLIVT